MSDKPSPVHDLKEGLGLIFRAAKTAASRLPTDKIEVVAKDAAKEVGRAFESLGNEFDKAFSKVSGAPPPRTPEPPPDADADAPGEADSERPSEAPPHDDAYAPEPPKGPRVG